MQHFQNAAKWSSMRQVFLSFCVQNRRGKILETISSRRKFNSTLLLFYSCPIGERFRPEGVTSTPHIAPFRAFSRRKVASSATLKARSITADRDPNAKRLLRRLRRDWARRAEPSWAEPICDFHFDHREAPSRHAYSRCTHALVGPIAMSLSWNMLRFSVFTMKTRGTRINRQDWVKLNLYKS